LHANNDATAAPDGAPPRRIRSVSVVNQVISHMDGDAHAAGASAPRSVRSTNEFFAKR
jgi:hypothetical protein